MLETSTHLNKIMKTKEQPIKSLERNFKFIHSHIGTLAQQQYMIEQLGLNTLDELIDQTIPENIRLSTELDITCGISEYEAANILLTIAKKNKIFKSFIGMGYYGSQIIPTIVRNLLENPGWYTAYTPYQTEISQGRMEMLLNFQQMVMDLTGLSVANSSLLDEATAAAEAMTLCYRASKKKLTNPIFWVADGVNHYTIDVIKTRAKYLAIKVVVADISELDFNDNIFAILLQYPDTYGTITNIKPIIQQARQQDILVAVATDLLALSILESPGKLGADVALGNTQRFGVPMGFGGPHAAFFAVAKKYYRLLPGRVIGVTEDKQGKTAYRLALQTREQHIRRDKATSNICTSQSLLANMATCYAIYHGASGLQAIAWKINRLAKTLYLVLSANNITSNSSFFDTLTINVGNEQQNIYQRALDRKINLRLINNNKIAISLDEQTEISDIIQLIHIITDKTDFNLEKFYQFENSLDQITNIGINEEQLRQDEILTNSVFLNFQTETKLVRYLKHLENKDYSLTHGMISLGSCTMKLNSAAQLQTISWSHFADIHPFSPKDQTLGYQQLIEELKQLIIEITGLDAVSLQPNSGAQGEFSGLITIREYHIANNEEYRNICLIPASAHGTNPASASMAGMKVIIINCDTNGNVDLDDLTTKAVQYQANLAALMITYPSTHGVFEHEIKRACDIVHQYGAQVYLDGANMNAQVGLTNPNIIGADVCHLNLHKTFAIPHGGGGPGMGPIAVKKHLAAFLPKHFTTDNNVQNSVSAAAFGNAGILSISWMYIKSLGKDGLQMATKSAILNANYIAYKLADYYPILYTGKYGKIAHECIIDIRPIKKITGISEEDIAKRLMDYSFHAPTMSFPVAGTLMIEPTESESLEEIERFITAMIAIRQEITKVENNIWSQDNNPLVNAPHCIDDLIANDWNYPYSRQEAVYPVANLISNKFWPTIKRVDNAKGDRNFICACPDISQY